MLGGAGDVERVSNRERSKDGRSEEDGVAEGEWEMVGDWTCCGAGDCVRGELMVAIWYQGVGAGNDIYCSTPVKMYHKTSVALALRNIKIPTILGHTSSASLPFNLSLLGAFP